MKHQEGDRKGGDPGRRRCEKQRADFGRRAPWKRGFPSLQGPTQEGSDPGEPRDGEIGENKPDARSLLWSHAEGRDGGDGEGGVEEEGSSGASAPAIKEKGEDGAQDRGAEAGQPRVKKEEPCEEGARSLAKGAKEPGENAREEDRVQPADGEKVADAEAPMDPQEFSRIAFGSP